jgi:hypothetical protein
VTTSIETLADAPAARVPKLQVIVSGSDRVDELAGEHHPVGVEREPDHQRA